MSSYRDIEQDKAETKRQLRHPRPARSGKNWLGHATGSRAAKIDAMLLRGEPLGKMAAAFDAEQRREVVQRSILKHFKHLEKEHGLSVVKEGKAYKFGLDEENAQASASSR